MYSANGRERKDPEVEKANKNSKHVLVCQTCDYRMPKTTKEFGEKTKCSQCGSEELTYKWE